MRRKRGQQKTLFEDVTESDEEEVKYSGSSSEGEWDEGNRMKEEEINHKLPPMKKEQAEFVAVKYDDAVFVGVIMNVSDDVKAMKRNGLLWKWPNRDDVCFYDWKNILGHLDAPKQFSSRWEIYSVPA